MAGKSGGGCLKSWIVKHLDQSYSVILENHFLLLNMEQYQNVELSRTIKGVVRGRHWRLMQKHEGRWAVTIKRSEEKQEEKAPLYK